MIFNLFFSFKFCPFYHGPGIITAQFSTSKGAYVNNKKKKPIRYMKKLTSSYHRVPKRR